MTILIIFIVNTKVCQHNINFIKMASNGKAPLFKSNTSSCRRRLSPHKIKQKIKCQENQEEKLKRRLLQFCQIINIKKNWNFKFKLIKFINQDLIQYFD